MMSLDRISRINSSRKRSLLPEIFPLTTCVQDFLPVIGFLELSSACTDFPKDTRVILGFDSCESLANKAFLSSGQFEQLGE
jgi:hypothetical protein